MVAISNGPTTSPPEATSSTPSSTTSGGGSARWRRATSSGSRAPLSPTLIARATRFATSGVLVLILVAARAWYVHSSAGGLFTMVIGPAAVAVLAAWYLHCTGEMRTPASTAAEPPQDE